MAGFTELMKKIRSGEETEKHKIGLALGGGAALGAAHVGVLRALEEYNIKPGFIAGTSIGAMVGAFYAFGKSVDEIEKIALELDWLDVSGIKLTKMGLLSNDALGDLLNKELGEVTFEEADIDLAVVATDISNGEKVIINEGKVSDAVKASACIPVIFEPVKLNDRLLVDGGLLESVPVSAVGALGAESIIAVDLKAYRQYRKPDDIINVLNNTLEVALTHLANVPMDDVDLLIQPKLGSYSRMDTNHSREMIELGYEAALEAIRSLE